MLARSLFFIFVVIFAKICATPKIAVVTMSIGENYQKLVTKSIENKLLYTQKYGYDFIHLTENLDSSRPIAWNKILILQDVLSRDTYDWIYWSDADALFANFDISLDEFIDDNFEVIVGSDLLGCNTGNFFLKCSEFNNKLLAKLYTKTDFIHNRYWEQAAFMHELSQSAELQSKTKILAPRVINAYPKSLHGQAEQYQPGDFILHFATISGDQLAKSIENFVTTNRSLTLDDYLSYHGLELHIDQHLSVNEGLMTSEQAEQYKQALTTCNCCKVAMIGFHAGHFAQLFLNSSPQLTITACDWSLNSFTNFGFEFLKRKHKDHLKFIIGDINHLCADAQNETFDLIFINGDRSYENRLQDILKGKKLSAAHTKIWINGCFGPTLKAVEEAEKLGTDKVEIGVIAYMIRY